MKTPSVDITTTPPPKSNAYLVTIPLASLNTNDGTSDVSPAVGDSVDIQASGTVASIEGDNAKINIDSINGNPISDSTETLPEPPPADTATSLRAAAQTADESNSY